MDRGDNPSYATCNLCGETFTLPEDDVEGNLPRVLLCSHIYCTSCLLSIQCDGVIKCPECDVEMTLPEGGVSALQEDSRIIGLIYTAKVNKIKSSRSLRCDRPKHRRGSKFTTSTDMRTNAKDMEKPADIQKVERTIDEAMVQGSRNLAQLEHIHKTLTTGLAEQVSRERAALEKEIKQTSDKALQAVQKWRDLQLNQLTKLEARFSTQETVSAVQERIKSLNIALQMAREVRRVPFLEQYCTLDKVLETLQTPVDDQSFDMTCITLDSGLRCDFRLESLNQSLSMSLKMEVSKPKPLSESQPRGHQLVTSTRELPLQHAEDRNRSCSPPSRNKPPTPRKQNQEILKAVSAGHLPSPRPRRKSSFSRHSLATNLGTPDVIIEEVIDERQHRVHPPTGPELANEKWRIHRRRKDQLNTKRDVTQWVVVTHIVNPSHFYVSYVAERRENETLSKKINAFCCKDSCHFTSRDTVETGSVIFVKWKEGLWCRARVVEVLQNGCADAVKTCPVNQLASIRVFLPDIGLTRSITLQSEMRTTKSSLEALNSHLRKAGEAENVELSHFTPLAIRCSLKDLVPYDLTKGWSEEAQAEFQSVVGSAAVEMRPLGQDRDSLLVDLRKAPMDQSSDVPISVREYLVFIEVARFYSPVTPGRRPLLYYPPVYPKMNTEVNAVVSHINNPADFYIQLVDNMESLLLSAKLQECYNSATLARGKDLAVYCPVIGHAYVARYDDKFWYRAQVIGHPGGRKVEVCYVDFGNKNILSVSDLRKIKDEFFALPTMAIHCCLSDVIPLDGQTWSDACTQRFISLAHQKLFIIVATGTIRKADPLPVKLFESSLGGPKDNIAELLVKEQLACFKSGLKSKDVTPHAVESSVWDPPLEPILASKCGFAPDQNITRKQKEELLEFEPVLKLTDNLKDIKIRVCHVNSPSSFYVQLIQYDSLLKRVCELVKQECALMEPQDVVWKANMYCGAQINGVWERGQILCDVTSSNIAEVIRCDHGNIVKLHISNLRPLPSSLMGSLALECTLTDIRPAGGRTTWTATACDLFSYYLTGTPAVMNIKELTDERPLPVSLFCSDNTGQFVSIADFLASEGLALKERKARDSVIEKPKETDAQSPPGETHASDDKKHPDGTPSHVNIPPLSSLVSTPAPPKPAPRTIMSAEKVKTSLYHPPELPCPGRIQMIVSAIGEDGLIFARTKNADCQLKQLQERIQQSMKTLPRQKMYTWKSVLGCAVIGPDMSWYRGQLLEVLGGHVKVQYVDYGLVENIPVVHVYPMLLCESVPQLCMPCKLHGVNPVGGRWHRDAVALLKEVLLNRCVDIQVMELPSDPRGPLTVEIFLDGMSLSRILCHHQHASVDQAVSAQKAYSVMSPAPSCLDDWDMSTEGLRGPEEPMLGRFPYPSLPQKGEQFRVRVKHLLTPNELFLWSLEETADVEVDGETLDEALYRINEDIDSLTHLTNYPQGGPCLAEYSDGRFYRARLIKLTSVEPIKILVQHVDFGSDDTLPPSKLRQMPAELLRFPSKALKVKVAGFKAPSVNRQDNVLPYSPEWSVKAAMDMIELLHNNITATVVAQEPELTVLLYNEDGDLVHLPLVIRGLAEIE